MKCVLTVGDGSRTIPMDMKDKKKSTKRAPVEGALFDVCSGILEFVQKSGIIE